MSSSGSKGWIGSSIILFASLSFVGVASIVVLAVRQIKKDAPSRDWTGVAPGYAPEAPAKNGFSIKKIPANVDVIVIGSGLGGLVAANLLAQQGKVVVVLEQHDVAGGCTHSFLEKGYEFDVGLHYVGADCGNKNSEIRKLFDTITQGGVQWHDCSAAENECFDEAMLFNRTDSFAMHRGQKRIESELCARFPTEIKGIKNYFSLLEKAQSSCVPIFVSKLLPLWLARCLLPFVSANFANLAGRSLAEVLSDEVTHNVELAGILAYCWGDYGSAPYEASFFHHALIAQHYFQGSFYPIGGPAQIARCAILPIENAGGVVLVRSPVEKILMKARDEDRQDEGDTNAEDTVYGVKVRGYEIQAPIIIAACGLRRTLSTLLPQQVSKRRFPEACASLGLFLEDAKKSSSSSFSLSPSPLSDANHSNSNNNNKLYNTTTTTKTITPSASLATLFVALDGDYKTLGLTATNLWVFPSWDHSTNAIKYKAHTTQPTFDQCPPSAVFISCSTAKDPSSSQRLGANKTSVTVICPVEYGWYAKYLPGSKIKNRGKEYNALKSSLIVDLLNVLYNVCPNITADKVVFTELGTPLTNNFYLGVNYGEVYGIDCTVNRWDTLHQHSWARSCTSIHGLYLSGQDVFSPGITGAAFSGLWAAAAVSPRVIWDHLGCFTR